MERLTPKLESLVERWKAREQPGGGKEKIPHSAGWIEYGCPSGKNIAIGLQELVGKRPLREKDSLGSSDGMGQVFLGPPMRFVIENVCNACSITPTYASGCVCELFDLV